MAQLSLSSIWITALREWKPLNGRSELRTAVWQRRKSDGKFGGTTTLVMVQNLKV